MSSEKNGMSLFIYISLAHEIRYHALNRGYDIRIPEYTNLSRIEYQKLRRQVLYFYGEPDLLTNKIDDVLRAVDFLLKGHLKAEDIELYHQIGNQIAQLINIEKDINKQSKEKLLKLVSMLDAAYLVAVTPSHDLLTEKTVNEYAQQNQAINGV